MTAPRGISCDKARALARALSQLMPIGERALFIIHNEVITIMMSLHMYTASSLEHDYSGDQSVIARFRVYNYIVYPFN